MSVVADHARLLDVYLDRIQLQTFESAQAYGAADQDETPSFDTALAAPAVSALAGIARSLSVGTSSGPLLKASRLRDLLRQIEKLEPDVQETVAKADSGHVTDLIWMVAAKAAVQTFAVVVTALLEETVALNDGIWYWDGVLGSYPYSGLYAIQTSPIRLVRRVKDVYRNIRQHGPDYRDQLNASALSARWTAFYHLVQDSLRQPQVGPAKQLILSPFQLCRSEARRNRRSLRKLREMNACAIGLLLEEGLFFDFDEDDASINGNNTNPEDWKDVVSRTTHLMRTVIGNVNDLDHDLAGFEDSVFASVEATEGSFTESTQRALIHQPFQVIHCLVDILDVRLPGQQTLFRNLSDEFGRPSRLIRYWLPASVFLLSSSTILNILTNRRAELITWVRDLGTTASDFWMNWVIDPLTKLVGTIRHDEKSEVALMSKSSLQSDLASLERMVVDFATRRPEGFSDQTLSPSDLEAIRTSVRAGDLTPILKSYERDMQKPFVGALKGDLITTLLIQIQKTKVDVEVAMSGIDSLLKSQELVFAFIGLTPGILVSYSAVRWIAGTFGSRKGIRQGKKRGEAKRSLRAVNRILASSPPTTTGILSYKDHGLLICEAEILRQKAQAVLPGDIYHEFHEDLTDLLDVRSGVVQQLRILDQIRWAYAKWIA